MRMMTPQYLTSAFCLCLILLSGCSSSLPQQQSSEIKTILTILPEQKAIPIPPSLIGMNIELTNLCAILSMDAAHPATFEQLFTNFGPGTLHIGGHSTDESIWQPEATPVCQKHPIVTQSLVQSLFAFARRIHWTVIWGLNYLINQPQTDADEAAYVSSVGGSSLLGFTMGNEPENFLKHGFRPAGWGYSNFVASWNADRNAILASVPTAHFFGPEACCQSGWLPAFLQDERTSGMLSAASHHYYYYSGNSAGAAHITVETLLSQQGMNQFVLQASSWVAAADEYKLPVDITEINSITNGGIRGVSDTFASALWVSNILFQSATLGIHQIDFQEVPDAAYAVINSQGTPQAMYNGLLFFHLATSSSTFLPSLINSAANISSYAFRGSDNTLRVVIINKTSQPSKISLVLGASYHTMTTLQMQAASLTSTSGITIGNTTLDSSGSWNMPALPHATLNTAQVTLHIPGNSAALFTFFP